MHVAFGEGMTSVVWLVHKVPTIIGHLLTNQASAAPRTSLPLTSQQLSVEAPTLTTSPGLEM